MRVERTISRLNDGSIGSGNYYSSVDTQNRDAITVHKEDYTHFGNGLMQAQSRMAMMYGKNNGKDCVVDFS